MWCSFLIRTFTESPGFQSNNQWQFQQVNVPGTSVNNYYLIIDGVVGNGEFGDIAIDDVSLSNGICEGNPVSNFPL